MPDNEPLTTTAGRLLINRELPEELRDYGRTLKGNDLGDLLQQLATDHPDLYKKVSHRLLRMGSAAAYRSGSTIKLEDFDDIDPKFKQETIDFVKKQEKAIDESTKMTQEEKDLARTDLYQQAHGALVKNTMARGAGIGNNIVDQVIAKARGNPAQVTAMLTTPGTYADAKGRTIPIFIERSYGQGLTPAEYYAATFGARTGVIATKFCLAEGTQVRMADFTSKAIEDVIIGDRVFTVNDEQELEVTEVTGVSDNGLRKCRIYAYTDGTTGKVTTINATADHKVMTSRGNMVPLSDAVDVRVYYGCAGHRYHEMANACDLGEINTYDLEVEHENHTFLLRNGMVVSNSTRNAGDLGKQIGQATNNLMVTEEDCGTAQGIPVKGDDIDNQGAVLAKKTNGYSRGEIINGKMIRKFGDKDILVRSPITCDSDRGVCSKCVGVREKGTLPEVGASVGISAASALAERIAQGSLNCLATGTEVMMADLTTRPIEKLRRGDKVLGADLMGNTFTTTVTALHNQGTKPVQTYHYGNNRTVTSTEIHPVLQEDKGQPSLQPIGNKLPAVLADSFTSQYALDISVAWFIGENIGGKAFDNATHLQLPTDMWAWSRDSFADFVGGLMHVASQPHYYKGDLVGVKMAFKSYELAAQLFKHIEHMLCVSIDPITTVDGLYCLVIQGPDSVGRLLEHVEMATSHGDQLHCLYGDTSITSLRTEELMLVDDLDEMQVWDISVEHDDSLFVLGNGLIVKNTKHTGGQKSTNPDDMYQGFSYINQFAQIPKHFRDGSTLSEVNGEVKVTDAPQGGWYVNVGDEQHYVEADRELLVKDGDKVEAGDQLSDGLINPGDVTRLKGVGEGRRYYTDRFTKLYRASGLKVNRRNVELAARGAVDELKIDDPDGLGDYLPDDAVSYSALSKSYKPREGAQLMKPDSAVGRYLEAPALHYSIGTPITSSVAKRLQDFDINEINTHEAKPQFSPNMQRMRVANSIKGNWLGKMQGSYLTKNLMEDLHYGGAESDIHGVDPVPAIIYGKELGDHRPGEVGY